MVNVDFADVRAVMADAGSSLMGIGTATGNTVTTMFIVFTSQIHFFGSLCIYSVRASASFLFVMKMLLSLTFHKLLSNYLFIKKIFPPCY